MTKPPTAGDQSVVTVVEISDPTDANAGVELFDLDAVQLQSIPMRVRRVVVRLESAAVVYHSANLRVRTRTSVRKGLLGYVAFGPQASGTSNGLPVRPGMMLAVAPEAENTFVIGFFISRFLGGFFTFLFRIFGVTCIVDVHCFDFHAVFVVFVDVFRHDCVDKVMI